ncbi:MAG: porin, partial [Candidatus Sedimenticola sp. (ex Thyasira tokunagai)]
ALALTVSSPLMAGGYKLPENSINGTALSAANVANAHGADASYYNPAAMVFNDAGASFEAAATLVHLPGISVTSTKASIDNDETKVENILVPSFHYISPLMGNMRYGLSVVSPGGLSKRWKGDGQAFAEEFTLKAVEINPTISFKINEKVSLGGGIRAIYSEGIVKSDDTGINTIHSTFNFKRDLEGDSWDFGYNLALHIKAADDFDLTATYRSKVELTEDGTATLTGAGPAYTGGASVMVPIPATLSLAAAYDVNDDTTVEMVLERTYWSAYKELDFNYASAVGAGYIALFDTPSPKNWKDVNTLRLGLTHQVNPKWTVMAGFAYDKTPAPEEYVGFELPDSDAKMISFGARYQQSDKLTIGGALLYDKKDKLVVDDSVSSVLTGETHTFTNAAAILATVGIEYKF